MALKGMFSQMVKPKVYKKLHYITQELLHIEEDLEKGEDFEDFILNDESKIVHRSTLIYPKGKIFGIVDIHFGKRDTFSQKRRKNRYGCKREVA